VTHDRAYQHVRNSAEFTIFVRRGSLRALLNEIKDVIRRVAVVTDYVVAEQSMSDRNRFAIAKIGRHAEPDLDDRDRKRIVGNASAVAGLDEAIEKHVPARRADLLRSNRLDARFGRSARGALYVVLDGLDDPRCHFRFVIDGKADVAKQPLFEF